uniref:Transketolase a n=1 Tax=Astyanax mexicanus TaxID=7994 RepID=A0A8B9JN61_ASTMX
MFSSTSLTHCFWITLCCFTPDNSSDILYFSHSLVLFCSRHPTSCCSVAEIMSVLFFHTMKYRPDDPKNPNNDRFVLSKKQQFVDVATGSLGQGLGVACGMAYSGKYFDKARGVCSLRLLS